MILYNVYNDIENRYEWDMSHDIFNGNQWDIQQSKYIQSGNMLRELMINHWKTSV